MAKQITFDYDGKSYTLEFTRNSVRTMENSGFKISDIKDKPVTLLPEFFAGAFLAHHKYTKRNDINKMFDQMQDKDELITVLSDMYNETLITLMGGEEETSGNISWKTT